MANDYVVVLGAISDARFQEGEGIGIPDYPTPLGAATFKFVTRYEDRGFDAPVPLDLWIDARGSSDAPLTATATAFGNTALSFVPLIAVAGNAWVGDVEINLAYDDTRGQDEHDFLQTFASNPEPDAIRFGRPLDRDATLALILAIGTHRDEGARLRRAAEQYRQALANWLNGHEVLAIAHLWIAVETLTKVAVRREQRATGATSNAELAEEWGIALDALDGEVRRRAIFQGDADVARDARRASDGLEHGYLDFGAIREMASRTRDATARYVREAIFEFVDLEEPWRSRLLAERYATPLRSWIVRYLRGKLLGDVDDLAEPDQAYPMFHWKKTMKSLSLQPDGSYRFQMDENFRSSFNDAVQFRPTSVEIWGSREGRREERDGSELEMTGVEERVTTTDEETA